MNYGYACINLTLASDGVTTNRGMIKRTFAEKGIAYASELALKNTKDLIKILRWNEIYNIPLFRITSDLFPWVSEYSILDMPDGDEISSILDGVKNIKQRISFHPGPYNNLGSPNEKVVADTIKDLTHHARLMNIMAQPLSPKAKINIHVGGTYGDKAATLERWATQFEQLPDSIKSRLTLENDDKLSGYSVKNLYPFCKKHLIPMVFDYHHHAIHPDGLTEQEAFEMAYDTWNTGYAYGVEPTFHYSNSKKKYEDDKVKAVAHSDWIYETPKTYGKEVSIMFETKMKDLAILKARKEGLL